MSVSARSDRGRCNKKAESESAPLHRCSRCPAAQFYYGPKAEGDSQQESEIADRGTRRDWSRHNAVVGDVRELLLHDVGDSVAPDDRAVLGLADVANLAVGVVEPTARVLRIRDDFNELVRGDRRLVIKGGRVGSATHVAE